MLLLYLGHGGPELVHLLPTVEGGGCVVFVARDKGVAVLPKTGIFCEIPAGVEAVDLFADVVEVLKEGCGGFYRVWVAGHCAFAVEIFLLKGGVYLVADRLLLRAELLELFVDAGADFCVYGVLAFGGGCRGGCIIGERIYELLGELRGIF